MTACARRFPHPFALGAYRLSLSHDGPQLRTTPSLCGAQFTAAAGLRVDSPWISPKTANVWTAHGQPRRELRLSTACPH